MSTDYGKLIEEARRRYKRSCDEIDRLTTGNPGTNWRWSIPANPERDSDLILSASVGDVPLLADAVEALVAENERHKADLHDWETEGAPAWVAERERQKDEIRAERDALQAQLDSMTEEWEYGWFADEEQRKQMVPRGPKLLIDSYIDTPENLARFPKGKRVRRRKAGPWLEVEGDKSNE